MTNKTFKYRNIYYLYCVYEFVFTIVIVYYHFTYLYSYTFTNTKSEDLEIYELDYKDNQYHRKYVM